MPIIQDPKVNPVGERQYGVLLNEADGHYYDYVKKTNAVRELLAQYKIDIGQKFPAYLVIPKLSPKELNDYQNLDFNALSDPLLTKLHDQGSHLIDVLKNEPYDVSVAYDGFATIIDIIQEIIFNAGYNQPVLNEVKTAVLEKVKSMKH
ncbi:MAG TPA: hypothetical protein VI583_16120 [Cyclobacteriaceae bacterium]|nr:hypothetical protein [Cyclobacteriaceae bacterium]